MRAILGSMIRETRMLLTSVNVGQPREVMHGTQRVRTGIFKHPVAGPVHVGRAGLDGDGQADPDHHGGTDKAVYAFALEQYEHWQESLAHPGMPFGQFGENLTIAGLDESASRVGDRLRIGDALLVITQPRSPCFKLGIRMQRADMPKLFSAHARTGYYLRVEREGTVAAGDRVDIAQRAEGSVTIRDLFRAIMNPRGRDASAILARALEVPELAATLRDKIERRLRDA